MSRMCLQLTVGQGPAGPAGAPGAEISAFSRIALQPLGGHRIVIGVGADGADYADAGDASHYGRVIGMTTGAAALGAAVNVQVRGFIDEPSWSWTPELDVWLGVNGLLTQTPPSDSAALTQRIGFALTPTRLWIDMFDPIIH